MAHSCAGEGYLATNLHGISAEADKLIINEETGGKAYYEAFVLHPVWPGGASGVTIGCGYDCGYSDDDKIREDWSALLSPEAIQALQGVSGVKGEDAKNLAKKLRWITVPWEVALAVFHNLELPRWTNLVRLSLPNCDKLNEDCFGALVSLAFNRGASFNSKGPRYAEMRAIKAHMHAETFHKIPGEFLAMRRLWPKSKGLRKRREHEATLFSRGLAKMAPAPNVT